MSNQGLQQENRASEQEDDEQSLRIKGESIGAEVEVLKAKQKNQATYSRMKRVFMQGNIKALDKELDYLEGRLRSIRSAEIV